MVTQGDIIKQDGNWRIKIWCHTPQGQPIYTVQNDLLGYWTVGTFYFTQDLAEKAMCIYKERGWY